MGIESASLCGLAKHVANFGIDDDVVQHAGRPVSRARLAELLGLAGEHGSRSLDMRVQRVRRRLGIHSDRIETIPRLGYRFRAEPARGSWLPTW